MNVVFAINVPYPSGMAGSMRIRLFAEYLVKNSYNVKVVSTNQENGNNCKEGNFHGIEYSGLSHLQYSYYLFLVIYPFLVFSKLRALKKKESKNILFIYGDPDIYRAPYIIIGKLLGYKVILDIVEDRALTEESLSIKASINLIFGKIIFPFIIKMIDGVIVISKYLEKKYSSFQALPVVLIPVSAFNLSSHINLDDSIEGPLKIMYAGSFGTKDGVSYLLDSFIQINKEYVNTELFLIGTPSKTIKDKIKRINNSNIHITGYLSDEDYFKTLASADILCMTRINSPFANAGFPFKLGEYLATGNPVIATDVSDIGLYLEDKKNVVLAQPSSSESLIEAIRYLISEPEKRKAIGLMGLKKCEETFNPEINGKKLSSFITKVSI